MTARPSQLNQDLKCLEHFNHKRDGYFVDIGSHDGKDLSNTYRLEKEYGWKGICVEPLEEEFKKCVESRPSSICVNTCIYDHNGTVRFNQVTRGNNYNMLSGIDDENYKCRENFIQVEKPCITLTKLLEDNNCPSVIDFLSIDTEGSELKILKGLDHNKFSFRYLTCEHNYDNEKRKDIKEYLESVGYNFYMENQWDDIFIKV